MAGGRPAEFGVFVLIGDAFCELPIQFSFADSVLICLGAYSPHGVKHSLGNGLAAISNIGGHK